MLKGLPQSSKWFPGITNNYNLLVLYIVVQLLTHDPGVADSFDATVDGVRDWVRG